MVKVVKKKPAANASKLTKVFKGAHKCSLKECSRCPGKLFMTANQTPAKCFVIGGECIKDTQTVRVQCASRSCRTVHRVNFAWSGGHKLNCLSFQQMVKEGVYFASNNVGFTMPYLEMTYYRLLRGRLAPGQEAEILRLYHCDNEDIFCQRKLRDNLLNALEGFALAKRTPDEVVEFDLENPAGVAQGDRSSLLFPPPCKVKSVSFDGMFGINRELENGVDPARKKRRAGKPRKRYKEFERTCSCANKTKVRLPLGNRTGGWQFVVDPISKRCLGLGAMSW